MLLLLFCCCLVIKKKKLFRLIDIYSKFDDIVDSVKDLNTKVDRVKQLKDASNDGD